MGQREDDSVVDGTMKGGDSDDEFVDLGDTTLAELSELKAFYGPLG